MLRGRREWRREPGRERKPHADGQGIQHFSHAPEATRGQEREGTLEFLAVREEGRWCDAANLVGAGFPAGPIKHPDCKCQSQKPAVAIDVEIVAVVAGQE